MPLVTTGREGAGQTTVFALIYASLSAPPMGVSVTLHRQCWPSFHHHGGLGVVCRYLTLDCPCILPPSSRLPGRLQLWITACAVLCALHVIVMDLHILPIRPPRTMDIHWTTFPPLAGLSQVLPATKGPHYHGIPRIRHVLGWLPPPALPLPRASSLRCSPHRVRVCRPGVWRCVYRRECTVSPTLCNTLLIRNLARVYDQRCLPRVWPSAFTQPIRPRYASPCLRIRSPPTNSCASSVR